MFALRRIPAMVSRPVLNHMAAPRPRAAMYASRARSSLFCAAGQRGTGERSTQLACILLFLQGATSMADRNWVRGFDVQVTASGSTSQRATVSGFAAQFRRLMHRSATKPFLHPLECSPQLSSLFCLQVSSPLTTAPRTFSFTRCAFTALVCASAVTSIDSIFWSRTRAFRRHPCSLVIHTGLRFAGGANAGQEVTEIF